VASELPPPLPPVPSRPGRTEAPPSRRAARLLGPGLNRCAVHPLRPALCRLYPSDLTRFGVMIGTPADNCPPGAFSPERVDLAPFRLAHARAADERARWRAFLEAWHAPASQALLASLSPEAARSAFHSAVLAAEAPAASGPPRRPAEGANGG